MTENFIFYDRIDGNNQAPTVLMLPVADSQTINKGDLVVISSAEIIKAVDATAIVMGIMGEDVVVATPTDAPLHPVHIISKSHRYRATASADASSVALGTSTHDIVVTTQLVDVADTSNGCMYIWPPLNTAGTDVLVSFSIVDYVG